MSKFDLVESDRVPVVHHPTCGCPECYAKKIATASNGMTSTSPVQSHVDRFEEILDDMLALHIKKGADYGSGTDPYANVRASQEFGVAPWIGALVRMNDKITRLKSFIAKGRVENESVLDSIRDIAVYAVIMRILYEEEHKV